MNRKDADFPAMESGVYLSRWLVELEVNDDLRSHGSNCPGVPRIVSESAISDNFLVYSGKFQPLS